MGRHAGRQIGRKIDLTSIFMRRVIFVYYVVLCGDKFRVQH